MEHDKSCPATYETLKTVFALNANQMVLKPPMKGKLEGLLVLEHQNTLLTL